MGSMLQASSEMQTVTLILNDELVFPKGNYGLYIVNGNIYYTSKQIPLYSKDYTGVICSIYSTNKATKNRIASRQTFEMTRKSDLDANVHVGSKFYPNGIHSHTWAVFRLTSEDMKYMYCSKKGKRAPSKDEIMQTLSNKFTIY